MDALQKLGAKKLKKSKKGKKNNSLPPQQVYPAGERYDGAKDVSKKAKSSENLSTWISVVNINLCRICMFIICYQYHSVASFLNLFWLFFSFIFNNETTFLLTIAGYISLLTW
jgi:hypothetical protein